MWNLHPRWQFVFVVMTSALFYQADAAGTLTVGLMDYGASGNCDSAGFFDFLNIWKECDLYALACVGYEENIGCKYGQAKTPVISDSNYAQWAYYKNFKIDTWTGEVSIRIAVFDEDNGGQEILAVELHTHKLDSSDGKQWYKQARNGYHMQYSLEFKCDDTWYGDVCDVQCVNPTGNIVTYTCNHLTGEKVCLPGWGGADCNIEDDNCAEDPEERCPADRHQQCSVVSTGITRCTCLPGYEPVVPADTPTTISASAPLTCAAIKACTSGEHDCNINAVCTDLGAGRFGCHCEDGYTGDGRECTAVNNCDTHNGGCSDFGTCTSTGPGTSTCTCMSGYQGDGEECLPVDNCKAADRGGCHENALCAFEGPGKNTCVCQEGFRGDGVTCDEINVCVEEDLGFGGCGRNSTCMMTGPGTNNCTCHPGFYSATGAGNQCLPDDSCMLPNNGGCGQFSSCRSVQRGVVSCRCSAGYRSPSGRHNDCVGGSADGQSGSSASVVVPIVVALVVVALLAGAAWFFVLRQRRDHRDLVDHERERASGYENAAFEDGMPASAGGGGRSRSESRIHFAKAMEASLDAMEHEQDEDLPSYSVLDRSMPDSDQVAGGAGAGSEYAVYANQGSNDASMA